MTPMAFRGRFAAALLICVFLRITTDLALAAERNDFSVPTVTVVACPNGGSPVSARLAADGAIHLLYDQRGLCWHTVSRDNGRTFEKPICVVDPDSRKPGLEFAGADMAIGDKRQVFVAMSTNAWKLNFPKTELSLHYATLAPTASAFSPVRNLNSQSSEGFSLAADDRGNVAAVWLSEKLYANFSRDGGRTFSSNAQINTECDPCPCCTTSSVFRPNGDLAVLYREKANNNRDMYVLIEHRDGRVTRKRVSTTLWNIDACPMSCFCISSTPAGYVAAWPTRGQVFFTRLDKEGNQLFPGEVATDGRAGIHDGILALESPNSQTLIAWNYLSNLTWQVFDAAGRRIGPSGSAPITGKWAPGVVLNDGRFILFK
jgi:hypothetical protein